MPLAKASLREFDIFFKRSFLIFTVILQMDNFFQVRVLIMIGKHK